MASGCLMNATNSKAIRNVDMELTAEALKIDRECGVDKYFTTQSGKTIGAALRIQLDALYSTFSIRKSVREGGPTELDKRSQAVKSGDAIHFPEITCQCYILNNVVHYGYIRTQDLYKAILNKAVKTKEHLNPDAGEGVTFVSVSWNDLRKAGVPIWTGEGEVYERV
jgi:hypothetical protein